VITYHATSFSHVNCHTKWGTIQKKVKNNPFRQLIIPKETYKLFNPMEDQSELFNIPFKLRKALT